jgi:hypothetical protein
VIATPVTLPMQAGPVPDRLSIWPMHDGRFGLDATFEGTSGCQRLHAHERELNGTRVPHTVHQEQAGSWTLRFGPLTAHDLGVALNAFVY